MAAARGITFNVPFINYEVKIPLSMDQRIAMQATVREAVTSDPHKFDQMHATILKLAPIALGILAAIVLSPIWMPVAMLSSFVLGPITWILAGVGGCVVWDLAKKVVNSFDTQCREIIDYAAARLSLMDREVTVEAHARA